jgi:hypothetical protein
MRSYMEVGPEAAPEAAALNSGANLRYYIDYLNDKAKERGWFLTVLWEGVFGIFIFNAPLATYLQGKSCTRRQTCSTRDHRMVKTPATRAMGQTLPGTGSRHRRARGRTGRAGGAGLA